MIAILHLGLQKGIRAVPGVPLAALGVALLAALTAGSGCAQSGPAEASWDRWRAGWTAAEATLRQPGADLASLAAADSARGRILDSLCAVLQAPEPALPPVSRENGAWARQAVLSSFLGGAPGPAALLQTWKPQALRSWNEDGALTLPAATLLASNLRWREALAWLEAGPLAGADRPYGWSLEVEASLALGDSAAAGERAAKLLASEKDVPDWARADLEQARILADLARPDTAAARRDLASFAARDRHGFEWTARRRLALLEGDAAGAEALAWKIADGFPSGKTAGALLEGHVPLSGPADPALSDAQRRVLLEVCEARGELDRFLVLQESLAPRLTPSGRDSLVLRGARLASKSRAYERLLGLAGSRRWTPRFTGEWGLLLARAARGLGRTEEMGRHYGEVAAKGNPEDRATALWEWARELESLDRFERADALYARYAAVAPADKRPQAWIRRGICRAALGDWAGARTRLEHATVSSDPAERSAAWFWTYRADLGLRQAGAARAALRRAADTGDAYYAWRARSVLELEREEPAVFSEPAAYWRAVSRRAGVPDLGERVWGGEGPASETGATGTTGTAGTAAAASSTGSTPRPAAWSPSPALRHQRDILVLFRLCGREAWASALRQDLEADPELGRGDERAARLGSLGLPDLAARSAVRAGGAGVRSRYPAPFGGAVAGAARRTGIAPEWLWAVMRRESFFESSVVSAAGATGLLQLMGTTAQATATRHGLPAGPLRSPEVNVALGAAHLSDLLAETREWPVILAAYNAGMQNAVRWKAPRGDPDLYIELIGYRETREYVQRVLESFWTYRSLLRGNGH